MKFLHTDDGGVVAVLTPTELVLADHALDQYLLGRPDSNLAVEMCRELGRANRESMALAEERAAEAGVELSL